MEQSTTPDRRRRGDAPAPPAYIVESITAHTHSFILLHGLGSNGEKFGREMMDTGKNSDGRLLSTIFPGARFVFPTARWRRSSAFRRALLTQWFDVADMQDRSLRNDKKLPGLRESFREVLALIENERRAGISAPNIILGGLSNGCAMSLICAIALGGCGFIGGFVGLSGWMPFQKEIEQHIHIGDDDSSATKAADGRAYVRELLQWDTVLEEQVDLMPVFLGHGAVDEKLPLASGEEASRTMSNLGFDVEGRPYEGLGHWYKIPDEIDDVVSFVNQKCRWEANDTTAST
ncbi:hypothetical protein HMPREF1624_06281 [Sporothrix schenckii ATCC 58251]|uniref:Phospholipase/carboxylesterase/thioesterase domain-containing protein n=1 Tax=Sporothrix schenckii (strain ATCC 58251 / de Perez 2211183) TaxID=1391915 RepID=U7PQG1_SPOS1|nr:hypothetical protein HMPREF1624_06281 [Sporothrix schenckii ATCC 58251]